MDSLELTKRKISNINRVEDFDPELLALDKIDLSTGEPRKYLPVKAQIAWFWLVYPKGKIDCVLDKVVGNTAYATCRLYADRYDPPEAFLVQQTATFSRIEGSADTAAFVERAQTSAMGRTLRFAQFGNQFDYAGDSVPPSYVDPDEKTEGDFPFEPTQAPVSEEKAEGKKPKPVDQKKQQEQQGKPSNKKAPEKKDADDAQTINQRQQQDLSAKGEKKEIFSAIPTTLEEAMNTKISLPRFKGKTFNDVLADAKNETLPEWINKHPGFAGLDDATSIAAQIIRQTS